MNINLAIVLVTTFVVFSSFYAPQPLLPFFSQHFSVSATTTAWLVTAPFLVLCAAPLFYGALLQRISAKILLLMAVTVLSVLQLTFAASETFTHLLFVRTLQALVYPAIFTAAVTYCSQAGDRREVSSRVALYIAITIVGGLGGRLISGLVSSWFHWTVVFQLIAGALLLCALLLLRIKPDSPTASDNNSTNHSKLSTVLKNRTFQSGYLLIFSTFFAFSATLTALPFRLVDLTPDVTPLQISLVYSGYSIGVIIATHTTGLASFFGGRVRAMTVALTVFLIGLATLAISDYPGSIAACFLTAGGMFLIHATLSGFLTSLQPDQASLINGVYISIYYIAGASGSILPLWIYNNAGWNSFLLFISSIAALGYLSLSRLIRESNRYPGNATKP